MKGDKVNFGLIGEDSSRSQEVENIIKVLFEDVDFAKEALPIIPQNEFANINYRFIIGMMKDFYSRNNKTPKYEDIISMVKEKYEGLEAEEFIAYIEAIRDTYLPSWEAENSRKNYRQYFKKALYAKLANYMYYNAPYFESNEAEIVREITKRYNQFIEYWNSTDLFQGSLEEGIFTDD